MESRVVVNELTSIWAGVFSEVRRAVRSCGLDLVVPPVQSAVQIVDLPNASNLTQWTATATGHYATPLGTTVRVSFGPSTSSRRDLRNHAWIVVPGCQTLQLPRVSPVPLIRSNEEGVLIHFQALTISYGATRRYAFLTGDDNPIHAIGIGRKPIVHGMNLLSEVQKLLTATGYRSDAIRARFNRTVSCGDECKVRVERLQGNEIVARVLHQNSLVAVALFDQAGPEFKNFDDQSWRVRHGVVEDARAESGRGALKPHGWS